nr:hypothetical protein [Tanacetum cinerariifolium]
MEVPHGAVFVIPKALSMAFKMWFMPFETAGGTVVLTLEMEALFLADSELLFE